MKRFIVLAGASLTLLAGNAFAEGCSYGQKALSASAHDAMEAPRAEEASGPELLALLKKQEEEALEQTLVVPDVHN